MRLAILIFLFFSTINVNAKQDIRLKFCFENQTLFPFYLGDSLNVKKKNPGAGIEEIQMLVKDFSGVKLQLVRASWERCKKFLYSGQVDAVVASYKPRRALYAAYPKSDKYYISNTSSHLYKKKNTKFSWNGKEFVNYNGESVGFIAGHSIKCKLNKHGIITKKYYKIKEALNDINKGKIVALAAITMSVDYTISENIDFKDIKRDTIPIETRKYYLTFSKKFYNQNKELAEKMWNQYRVLRKTCGIPLIRKYFVFKSFDKLST